MNKQEIKNKIEDIFTYINPNDFTELTLAGIDIFNFAIELAAEKSKILNCSYLSDPLSNKEEVLFIVDKESILKYKL